MTSPQFVSGAHFRSWLAVKEHEARPKLHALHKELLGRICKGMRKRDELEKVDMLITCLEYLKVGRAD